MTIYIDVTRLLSWKGNYTGMERIAYEVTRCLLDMPDRHVKLCIYTPSKGFVSIGSQFTMSNGKLVSAVLGPRPSIKQFAKASKRALVRQYGKQIRGNLNGRRLERVMPNGGDAFLIYDGLWDQNGYIDSVKELSESGARIAHVVCDVIPTVMPHVCYDFVSDAFNNYFHKVTPYIDTVLSISEHTNKDFMSAYGSVLKPASRSSVIRLADEVGDANKGIKPNMSLKSEEYLLAVGTVEVRKNHQLLYQAYRLAAEQGIDLPPLVIVGREGWLAESALNNLKKDPIVKDKIIFAGSVTDANLRWLYENCLFSIFPSLYEGWGLPVAESLCYGKVCAASSSSSIPEIGGNLNLYYSPYNPQECLQTITKLLDEKHRKHLEEKIKNSYSPVKWEQTTRNVLDALES